MLTSIRRIYACIASFFDHIMANFLVAGLLILGLFALDVWSGKIMWVRILYLLSKMGL